VTLPIVSLIAFFQSRHTIRLTLLASQKRGLRNGVVPVSDAAVAAILFPLQEQG